MNIRGLLGLAFLAGCLATTGWLLPQAESQGEGPPVVFQDYPTIDSRIYLCYRASSPPKIDGKLNERAWHEAPWSEDFLDIQGPKLPRPRHRTRMKMLWDDQYLYIGAQLDEPHVWATLTKHDSVIFHDNDFEVFLDPDADNHLYAELELNAFNTTWDLLLTRPYKDEGKAVDAWEIPGLRTAVWVDGTLNDPRDTDRGWSVEIAWPWASVKELSYSHVPPRDGDAWRINFSRVEWQHEVVEGKYRKVQGKPEDNWVWSHQGVIDMHRPERWGIVQFSSERPGTATPRRDPAAEVRQALHRTYYAQRDYRKAKGRWANRLVDLGLAGPPFDRMRLETTETGFEASLSQTEGSARARRWRIRSEGRIWSE